MGRWGRWSTSSPSFFSAQPPPRPHSSVQNKPPSVPALRHRGRDIGNDHSRHTRHALLPSGRPRLRTFKRQITTPRGGVGQEKSYRNGKHDRCFSMNHRVWWSHARAWGFTSCRKTRKRGAEPVPQSAQRGWAKPWAEGSSALQPRHATPGPTTHNNITHTRAGRGADR